MKQTLIILFAFGFITTAEAQKVRSGRVYQPRQRVVIVAPSFPAYGYGYGARFGYSPFYSPIYDPFYRMQPSQSQPNQLQLEIDDIENEYSYRLSTARNDKTLSRDNRKQKIRELKHERDNAIIDAKKDYYMKEETRSS